MRRWFVESVFVGVCKGVGLLFDNLRITVGLRKPLVVIHNLTYKCNLRCAYCGRWKSKCYELTTEEVLRAMDEFHGMGAKMWIITGGEPLLRRDLKDIIEHAVALNMYVILDTNGILLPKRIDDIRKIGKNGEINISIDGSEEIHDKIRGSGSYKKALRGVKTAKENGLVVHINCVLSSENIKDDFFGLICALETAKKLNVPFYLQPLYKSRFNGKMLGSLVPEPKKYLDAIKTIHAKYDIENFSSVGIDWFENFYTSKNNKCLAGQAFAEIFPDGRVSNCFFREELAVDGKEVGFANAFAKLSPIDDDCHCRMPCHIELSKSYSLNPKVFFRKAKRYIMDRS